jgi:hypothetical protein
MRIPLLFAGPADPGRASSAVAGDELSGLDAGGLGVCSAAAGVLSVDDEARGEAGSEAALSDGLLMKLSAAASRDGNEMGRSPAGGGCPVF